jgi:hypothetical protein
MKKLSIKIDMGTLGTYHTNKKQNWLMVMKYSRHPLKTQLIP